MIIFRIALGIDFDRFWAAEKPSKSIQNPQKNDPEIDVIFDIVFGSIFDRFPEPLNPENGVFV